MGVDERWCLGEDTLSGTCIGPHLQIVCHPAWGGIYHDFSWVRPPHATWKVLCLPVSISMGDWEDTFTMIGGSTFWDCSLGLYGLGCASIPNVLQGHDCRSLLMALSQMARSLAAPAGCVLAPAWDLPSLIFCLQLVGYWKHRLQVSGSKLKN